MTLFKHIISVHESANSPGSIYIPYIPQFSQYSFLLASSLRTIRRSFWFILLQLLSIVLNFLSWNARHNLLSICSFSSWLNILNLQGRGSCFLDPKRERIECHNLYEPDFLLVRLNDNIGWAASLMRRVSRTLMYLKECDFEDARSWWYQLFCD
jgi:hypothetical protein